MCQKNKLTYQILIREFVKSYLIKSINDPDLQSKENNNELLNDPAYQTDSIYVPNNTKKKINKWARSMGLLTK